MSNSLNDWKDRVHALAREKGWYEGRDVSDPNVLGAMLALIHSEVSEALEEVRVVKVGSAHMTALTRLRFRDDGKPEGFSVELADIIIRVLDMCGALGIDIEDVVTIKHAFNASRPHRHGGKAL